MRHPSQITNILLDRDGTIIYDRHYLADPGGVRLLPGAVKGLEVLSQAGCRLFLVTNQSGVGRGFFSLQDFYRVQAALYVQLQAFNIWIRDQAVCFHAPDAGCTCRKPASGLWTSLQARHQLRANQTLMIGDKESDIAFARNAGLLGSILISTSCCRGQHKGSGPEQDCEKPVNRHPALIAPDLEAAADWIVNIQNSSS
jgi:D-glycero-D-manno-heptose 1,7-bisphosphate phosphatase